MAASRRWRRWNRHSRRNPACAALAAPTHTYRDKVCFNSDNGARDQIWGHNLQIQNDFGGFKIKSTTGYRIWHSDNYGSDMDGLGQIQGPLFTSSSVLNGMPLSTLQYIYPTGGTAAYLASQPVPTTTRDLFTTQDFRKQKQFSEEVEVSGDTDHLDWVVGGFYFYEKGSEYNPQNSGYVLDTNAAVFTSATFGGLAPLLQAGNPARYRLVVTNSLVNYLTNAESVAVYGQGTYYVDGRDGKLSLTGGLRYTWDNKSIILFQNGPAPLTTPDSAHANFQRLTWNAMARYAFTHDISVYARAASGYRSGGFNPSDTPPLTAGGLDVLAQHVLGCACAAPFLAEDLLAEIRTAAPYADLDGETFGRVVDFVATGGYALKNYERYARIRKNEDGRWRVSHPRVAQQYRLNVGTIVEMPELNVRYVRQGRGLAGYGGRVLGKVEEYFAETLRPGDNFLFAGKVLRFEGIRENECVVSAGGGRAQVIVPSYAGGKFPLSTYLADQVRAMLADPARWSALPEQVSDWLRLQKEKSVVPKRGDLLVETFPRGDRHYMVCYPFEGRLAHQTLGMLLTRRLERADARPLGFVATDYSLAVWALDDMGALFRAKNPSLAALFDEDMLGDDLEAWLNDSWMLKRMFRTCAVIAGLIEKRFPGQEKTGRQVTVSADLIYDVLRSHEPDHILLQATRADAAAGLLDVSRLADMLSRVRGRIVHKHLEHISPLAVPVMLEIGKESVNGGANESLLMEAADLIEEAMGAS